MAVIDISQVKINTVAVEIKTLSLNKKQMTLSFFRQITPMELIDYKSSRLNGIPWGRINYFINSEHNAGNSMNIIWQKGNDIFRNCIELYDDTNSRERDLVRLVNTIASLRKKTRELQQEIEQKDSMIHWNIERLEETQKRISACEKEYQEGTAQLELYKKYRKLVVTLQELPQLFIAV